MPSKSSDTFEEAGEETRLLLSHPPTPPNEDLESRSVEDSHASVFEVDSRKSPAAIISVLLIGKLKPFVPLPPFMKLKESY